MSNRCLTALPVYNEVEHVLHVIGEVKKNASDVLVVDDGSTDGTSELIKRRADIRVLSHPQNLGYGAALCAAFEYAIDADFDFLVTIDCDGQHEPQRIPAFFQLCQNFDIVSGSRYLQDFEGDSAAPEKRKEVNQHVTAELNSRLGLKLTDAFCGFKAYRVSALKKLTLTETGYAMPLELWVQAAHAKLRIIESPVPRIYLDHSRSFGGQLDDTETRLEYYHLVIERSIANVNCDSPDDACGVGSKRKDNL